MKSGLVKVHSAVLLFGIAGLFARFVSLPAPVIALGRVLFSSAVILIAMRFTRMPLCLSDKRHYRDMAVAGALLAVHWASFFLSIQRSSVALGTLTFSTFPLFLAVAEPVMDRERIRKGDVMAALAMVAGVALMAPGASGDVMAGIAYGLLSSATYAALSLMNRRFSRMYPAMKISFYEQSAAFFFLLPFLWIYRPAFALKDVLLLALLGVVFTALAHSLFISGLTTVKARAAGLISGMESVYGIVAAAVLLAEYPSLRVILGGIVILAAAICATHANAVRERVNRAVNSQ